MLFILFMLWLATAGLLFLSVVNKDVHAWLVQLLGKATK